MSERDFNGLLFAPVITRPRRPLSNNASTDSCNILFSFLTMISGARSSINLFSRLFLLITRLYKSFKSEVANLPPSRGTSGRSSGGITGTTSNIIHSGLEPDSMKASINLRRFTNFFLFASDPVSRNSDLITSSSSSNSISDNIS